MPLRLGPLLFSFSACALADYASGSAGSAATDTATNSDSDTIGAGTPRQTKAILQLMLAEMPAEKIALHMHDTRGTALANIVVGLEMGIRDFDASIGGMGGCPYAPGAAGNVATEDLVYMLHGMGIATGIDLDRLVEAGRAAESVVGRSLPGKVLQAGVRSLRA